MNEYQELPNGDLLVDGVIIPKEKRQRCLVYSRIVGYMMPVENWNKGKKAEWKDRKTFQFKKEDVDARQSSIKQQEE